MKWPLRFQIMLPMTLLMLVTVIGLSVWDAVLAGARQRSVIEDQIRSIARTLSNPRFPLTDSVLKQMKGLAGAEFVVVGPGDEIQAATRSDWTAAQLPTAESDDPTRLRLSDASPIAGQAYLHAAFRTLPRDTASGGDIVHVLYPQALYRKQYWEAIFPTFAIGSVALVLVAASAVVIASRVSRPLSRLREQVGRIAQGHFEPMQLPDNQDEVRDLSLAVNRMAEMLSTYEATIRRTEQLRTVGQLGAGLAHQLRNAATGARMALDIHRSECPVAAGSESLDICARQLVLMEKWLQSLLSVGQQRTQATETLDVADIVRNVVALLAPTAAHAGVRLESVPAAAPVTIQGQRDGLEHLVLNLLINAIEAAAEAAPVDSAEAAFVCVRLQQQNGRVTLCVEDSGAGPPPGLADAIFDSFVTSKPEGIGLGLAIVKQVVSDLKGTIRWGRDGEVTRFSADLPAAETSVAQH